MTVRSRFGISCVEVLGASGVQIFEQMFLTNGRTGCTQAHTCQVPGDPLSLSQDSVLSVEALPNLGR